VSVSQVTHSFDNGQRLVTLEKTYTEDGKISFKVPEDKHFSPPGHYMLFYVNQEGKPSEGKIVKLS